MDPQSEQQPKPENEHIVFLNARGGGAYDGQPSWITSTIRDENFLASVDVLQKLKNRWETPVAKASWDDIKTHIRAVMPDAQITIPQAEILTVKYSTPHDTVVLSYDEDGREIFYSPFQYCTIDYHYDDDGYLVNIRQSQYGGGGHEDKIEYAQVEGVKKPVRMIRRLFGGKGGGNNPSDNMGSPISVDLQNLDALRAAPQPPQLPPIEEIKESPHGIKEVVVSENHSGIRCADWREVVDLLKKYGRGNYKGGQATVKHDRSAYDQTYGEEGEMEFANDQQDELDDFINKNFNTGENPVHSTGWEYDRWFDYDGKGGLFKSAVRIRKIEDGYILNLRAAYVGDDVEEQLAQAVNKPRGMEQTSVRVWYNAGDYFLVDFQQIIENLQKGGLQIEGQSDQLATDYAADILDSERSLRSRQEVILESSKDYEVFMRAEIPNGNRFFRTKDGKKDLWQSSSGAVFGPKEIDLTDETRTMLPSVIIGVRVKGDIPTFETELQGKLREKSRQISEALKTE